MYFLATVGTEKDLKIKFENMFTTFDTFKVCEVQRTRVVNSFYVKGNGNAN